ncbi:hypothetical protein GCM10009836_17970 [Pseudonocardia ailaonensis]|uniref:F5/8 type C domain-containing protein n=1 Tax=Pseudonocardia ailaonensis TaxID=367279 RepID=A0ABN2MWP2_9PSEU
MTIEDQRIGFDVAAADFRPGLPVAQRIREDASAAQLAGTAAIAVGSSGTFVDNGTDRWHYLIQPGTPNVLSIQLQVSDTVTWWKQIEVSASYFGSWFPIRTLETKDDKRVATVDLTPTDAQSGTLKLEFWRAGVLGFGVRVITLLVDVPSNLGNKIVYLCDRPEDL